MDGEPAEGGGRKEKGGLGKEGWSQRHDLGEEYMALVLVGL